jgi:hypothetical protein
MKTSGFDLAFDAVVIESQSSQLASRYDSMLARS